MVEFKKDLNSKESMQEVTKNAIREVIKLLDSGTLRVAEPVENSWKVNEWVKKAVVLSFIQLSHKND